MNLVQRILQKLLILQISFPRLTLAVAVAMALVSAFYTAGNLGFLTSQKQLISPTHRLIQLSERMDPFEDFDTLVVAVENREPSESLKFLQTLVPLLERDKHHYDEIFFRVDPKRFRPWALFYLSRKDLLTLHDSMDQYRGLIQNLTQSPTLTNFFRQINREMTSQMVEEIFTGFLEEGSKKEEKATADLDFLIRVLQKLDQWVAGDASPVFPWETFLTKTSWGDTSAEGYFWTDSNHYLLLFVTPAKTADTGKSLMALRQTIARIQGRFPGIQVGVTGPEALNEDEMQVALRDMSIATFLSLLGLTILLFLFWRGIRMPLLEMIQLLIALSLTFGLTTLLIGHLNLLSVSFAPMLLGLGIDYGVHWVSRYRELHLTRGVSKEEALRVTMIRLGPGILLAGLSAALSFFPLMLTGFKGLMELGVICSIGLILAMMSTLCLMPALLFLFDKTSQGKPEEVRPLRPLFQLTKTRALSIGVVTCLSLGFSLWGARHIRFDLNMLHLQSKRSESVKWEKKLIKDSKRPSMYGAVFAGSLEEVERKTNALEKLPSVSKVESIIDLLPSQQKEKVGLIRKMKPLLAEVGRFRNSDGPLNLSGLQEVLRSIRFRMADPTWNGDASVEVQRKEVKELIDGLERRFRAMEPSSLIRRLQTFQEALMGDLMDKLDLLRANTVSKPMKIENLPYSVVRRFVGGDGHYLIRVYPSQDIWETEILGKFVQELTSVDPDAIGDPVTLYVFTEAFRNACIKASLYAAVFIFVLLLLTFRSIVSALLAMIPLVVGTVWTFGAMSLFGINLNLANGIFLPLVVGAGVEYGIIILQRWRQREGQDVPILPSSTGQGVILAGLTTTVGFGSLMLSDHQGLHSLGVLTFIGSLVILGSAIFVLPAFLRLLTKLEDEK